MVDRNLAVKKLLWNRARQLQRVLQGKVWRTCLCFFDDFCGVGVWEASFYTFVCVPFRQKDKELIIGTDWSPSPCRERMAMRQKVCFYKNTECNQLLLLWWHKSVGNQLVEFNQKNVIGTSSRHCRICRAPNLFPSIESIPSVVRNP